MKEKHELLYLDFQYSLPESCPIELSTEKNHPVHNKAIQNTICLSTYKFFVYHLKAKNRNLQHLKL
jgi:hypothetical protein